MKIMLGHIMGTILWMNQIKTSVNKLLWPTQSLDLNL
jgi:hypothetical protein